MDVQHVGAHERNALEKSTVQAFDGRAHQGDSQDADDNAEGREHRAQLIGADGAPGDAEPFFKVGEKSHSDSYCATNTDGNTTFDTRPSALVSSLAIRPSLMRRIRRACLATSSSWVTTMIVLPFMESSSNRARISS